MGGSVAVVDSAQRYVDTQSSIDVCHACAVPMRTAPGGVVIETIEDGDLLLCGQCSAALATAASDLKVDLTVSWGPIPDGVQIVWRVGGHDLATDVYADRIEWSVLGPGREPRGGEAAVDVIAALTCDGPTPREAALIEALRMYADPESYFAVLMMADHPAGWFADDVDELGPGVAARAALREALG